MKQKTLNKPNFRAHLLKFEWKSVETHIPLSCFRRFYTSLRCWRSLNSTVSSQIVYSCHNRQAWQLVLCRITFQNDEETCRRHEYCFVV